MNHGSALYKLWKRLFPGIINPAPKPRRVIRASRSREKTNPTEEIFARCYGADIQAGYKHQEALRSACREAGISVQVGTRWLHKPKIQRAIAEFGGCKSGSDVDGGALDVATSTEGLEAMFDDIVSPHRPRILPAELEPGDGA